MYFIFLFFAVDADEIRRLGKRFRKLDLDNSGALSVEEFMSLPELQQNPLVQRVIDIFDSDGNGEVDFKGKNKNNCKSICLQDLRKTTVDLNMVQLICLIFILRWAALPKLETRHFKFPTASVKNLFVNFLESTPKVIWKTIAQGLGVAKLS